MVNTGPKLANIGRNLAEILPQNLCLGVIVNFSPVSDRLSRGQRGGEHFSRDLGDFVAASAALSRCSFDQFCRFNNFSARGASQECMPRVCSPSACAPSTRPRLAPLPQRWPPPLSRAAPAPAQMAAAAAAPAAGAGSAQRPHRSRRVPGEWQHLSRLARNPTHTQI